MIGFAVTSTLAAGVLLGGGWWAIGRWAPQWGLAPLVFGVAVNVVVGWIACSVITVVCRLRPAYVPQAAMGAMVIRILPAGAALLGAQILSDWDRTATWVCMFGSYLVFLVIETWMAVRLVGRRFEGGVT